MILLKTEKFLVGNAIYSGASAEVIAKIVSIPLEDEMNGVGDVIYMNSTSEDSAYTSNVTFKTGIGSKTDYSKPPRFYSGRFSVRS